MCRVDEGSIMYMYVLLRPSALYAPSNALHMVLYISLLVYACKLSGKLELGSLILGFGWRLLSSLLFYLYSFCQCIWTMYGKLVCLTICEKDGGMPGGEGKRNRMRSFSCIMRF